jgi:integrase
MTTHTILGGKVHVYKRPNSSYWQCSSYLAGRNRRTSTKHESLQLAKEFAEDWYLTLRDKNRQGALLSEKTFKQAAAQFEREYEIITEGQRSPRWVEGHKARLRLHLIPFFGPMGLSQITAGKVQEYRMHRMTPAEQPNPHSKSNRPHTGKPPSRSTLHDEIVTLRQVLKTALRHGWLGALPDLSPPYNTSAKVSHRAWFSPKEYKQLYTATRNRMRKPPRPAFKWHAEQLHDYVLFMANTGLRPDEARNLQHRDVEIVTDEWSGEKILEIEVRGKRGVGYCMSTSGAVRPYERLLGRPKPVEVDDHAPDEEKREPVYPAPTDPVFPGNHIKMLNNILAEEKLKFDRDGRRRTAYSLRHTYICLRLMEGADIYQIAKNCRTSVEMIEKHYAAHIKTSLDTEAINRRRLRPRPAKEQGKPPRRGRRDREDDGESAGAG